jgi:RNA polymerase sigma-70 factor (ECF subfamily)
MEDVSRDILIQASEGNMEAFEKIYKATSGFVYNVALRITASSQDAQEVTQDVFMKIYNNLKNFQFRSSFKTWIYRITVNTALNVHKRASREMNRRDDFDKVADTQASSDDTAEEIIQREESRAAKERLKSLLNVLNPQQRACIVLREIEGLSYQELSKALKININTVRSRLKRARQALLAYARGGGRSGL